MKFPDKVTAIVPISGTGIKADACKMKDVPVWGLHGERDTE